MENLGVSPLLWLNDLEDESVLGYKHSCDIEAKKEKQKRGTKWDAEMSPKLYKQRRAKYTVWRISKTFP